MGDARRQTMRFLAEHPTCCFCGGDTPASTRDHVPNRAAFPKRIGPEGYEFPACNSCQNHLRSEEQFFAFFVRMSDRDNTNYDNKTSERLISGIANNLPSLLPNPHLGPSEKRKALRNFGLKKPTNVPLVKVPMVALPRKTDTVIRAVGVKLALALFYKHLQKCAGEQYWITADWTQTADRRTMSQWVEISQELGVVEIGNRRNTNLGNLFRYRWAKQSSTESSDIFAAICQFGEGLAFLLMVFF